MADFQPKIRVFALASCVLVVATTRIEGTWCAYCDAVPGMRHDDEYQEVLNTGTKLPRGAAEALFPDFVKLMPYAS